MLESVKSCPICKKHVYIYICEYSVWFWVDNVMPLYLPRSLRNGPGLYWYCWVFWNGQGVTEDQSHSGKRHIHTWHKVMLQTQSRRAGGRHTVSWCSLSPSCELSKSEMPVAPSAIFWKKCYHIECRTLKPTKVETMSLVVQLHL